LGCCGGFGSRRPQRFAGFERAFPRSKFLTCENRLAPVSLIFAFSFRHAKTLPKKKRGKKISGSLRACGLGLPLAARRLLPRVALPRVSAACLLAPTDFPRVFRVLSAFG
jgi:hypothetical protein